MIFADAYAALKSGKFVARPAMIDAKEFIVLFPNMVFMWKITADPTKPNAGVWMASVADIDADDWIEVARDKDSPHVCDVDPA